MSRMSRFLSAVVVICLIGGISACSKSNAVGTATYAVPTSIAISPEPTASLEVGSTATFSASAADSGNHVISGEPISFTSSNQAVATVAANGLVCAGSWDSLAAPQICTPGQIGTAVVTATAQGVTSPATTVYVHQHIDKIVVSPVPAQPAPLSSLCFSAGQFAGAKGELYNYQANAYSGTSPQIDITSTVGPFTWQAGNASVVTLTAASVNSTVSGLLPGQVQARASVPGTTTIYASANQVNSAPFTYNTCAVQSISIEVNGNTGNSVTVAAGSGAKVINAFVTDILGNRLYGIPLTWCSSSPASVGVGGTACSTNASSTTAQYAGTVSATPSAVGDATITASCTPPNCNIGILPSQPIYPENVVNITATATTGGTGTGETATFYVSSTGCGTANGCVSVIYPLTASNNQLGTAAILPSTPNGLTFNPSGSVIFIGTDLSYNNTQGFSLYTPGGSLSRDQGVTGKVLAISPDGFTAIISDTLNTPNQVYIVNASAKTSFPLSIAGASAAAFSPDSLKAFIVAGSNLYVYSKLDALQTIALPNPATGVKFLPEGGFGFLAGGGIAAGLSSYSTCTSLPSLTVATAGLPSTFLPLPNATQFLSLDLPNIDIIDVNAGGCVLSGATLQSSTNLGQGIFTPLQMILSPDATKAYIISNTLSSIIVFDILGQSTTALPLSGNVYPVQAALSPDGVILAVAASDGTVHIINTVAGGDVTQVTFPQNLCQNTAGQPYSSTCKPDLIVAKP